MALAAAFVVANDQHSAGFFGAVLLLPFSAQNAQFGVVPVCMSMTSRTDGFTHSVEAWLPSSRLSGVPADRRALIRARLIRDLGGSDRPADDQRGERVRNLAAGLQVGLNVLLQRERHLRVPEVLAQRLPVDLRINVDITVFVSDVVKVDLRQVGTGSLVEIRRASWLSE